MTKMDSCVGCGKPTDSHQTADGPMCHSCYTGQKEERPEQPESLAEAIDEMAAIPDPGPNADPETCTHNYTKYPLEGMKRCHRCGKELFDESLVPQWLREYEKFAEDNQ